jgi:hypothetical protein
MKVGEYISKVLKSQGRQKTWLAEQLNISKEGLNYKIKADAFKANELIKISELLNIDLNKMREEINND